MRNFKQRLTRPRLLAGTTVGIVGVGTAVALLLGAASSSPAFAVNRGRDGTVNVVIRKLEAFRQVNQRLSALGLKAQFVHLAAGCGAPPPAVMASWLARSNAHVGSVTVKQGFVNARFNARKIPAGQMVVVAAWRQGREVKVSTSRIARGSAPGCFPVPRPLLFRALRVQGGPGGTVHCTVTIVRPAVKLAPAGNSGAASAAGNSGPPPTFQVGPAPGAGNSGPAPGAGNSGPPPAGNSGPPPGVPFPLKGVKAPPPGCPPPPIVARLKALAAAKHAHARHP
jgi:hypothetical protein